MTQINLRPYLEPFIPLLVNQNWEIREEVDTNKAWHLGQKEYEFVQTLHGPEPVVPRVTLPDSTNDCHHTT